MSEVKVKKTNAVVEYFQESFMEMKKVAWPTRNQAIRLTFLVLGFCVASAIVIGAVDALFSFGHQELIDYAATVAPVTESADSAVTDSSAIPISIPATTSGTTTSTPDATGAATTVPAAGTQQ